MKKKIIFWFLKAFMCPSLYFLIQNSLDEYIEFREYRGINYIRCGQDYDNYKADTMDLKELRTYFNPTL